MEHDDVSSSRAGRTGRRIAAAAALCAVAMLGPAAFRHESAVADESFAAQATAQLVGVNATAEPGILYDQLINAGVSQAQSQIDSLGSTSAYAADPYPSDSALGLPALLAGAAGIPAPIPTYPLQASSDQGHPSSRVSAGTLVLQATSTPGNSGASVADGATSATVYTRFDATSGAVTAHAESSIQALDLGPTLALHEIHTLADVTRNGATSTPTTSFEVGALDLLGTHLAVTQSGLSVAGTSLPLGVDPTAVLAPMLAALDKQGITVSYVPATHDSTSATSAGLVITAHEDPPPGAVSGIDTVIVSYSVGFARAHVSTSPLPGDDAFAPVDPPSTVPAAGNGQPAPPGAATPPVTTVPSQAALPDDGLTTPPAGASAPDVAPAPNPTTELISASRLDALVSTKKLYPVLVLAGLLCFGAAQVVRNLGVRSR